MDKIKIGGIYKHFKGTTHIVLAVAKHSETLEEMVVYTHDGEHAGIWVRPLTMFLEEIERDGKKFQRFELIS